MSRGWLWTPTQRRAAAGVALVLAGAMALRLSCLPMHVRLPDADPDAWNAPPELSGSPGATSIDAINASLLDRLNPNTATASQLAELPGIGPGRAERIVAFRDAEVRLRGGPVFRRLSDMARVPGIGPATIEQLEPFLMFPDGASVPASTTAPL